MGKELIKVFFMKVSFSGFKELKNKTNINTNKYIVKIVFVYLHLKTMFLHELRISLANYCSERKKEGKDGQNTEVTLVFFLSTVQV